MTDQNSKINYDLRHWFYAAENFAANKMILRYRIIFCLNQKFMS